MTHLQSERITGGRRKAPAGAKALAGLAVVLVLLFAVEALLALMGVQPARNIIDPSGGYDTTLPLMAPVRGRDGRIMMVTATNKLRFFNAQSFPREKPAGTTRIVCLGGSTTYGHPFRDPVSFPGWLREMLRTAAPDRGWEVINAGGISYASHRERAVLAELLRYQPDIVILLNGHNEFLEERTFRSERDLPPLVTYLRRLAMRLRLYAAMDRLYASRRDARLRGEVHTLLDESIGLDAYDRDDDRAARIVAEYRAHMQAMAQLARRHHVRMIWVEPVSQLRGCAPFKSEGEPAPEDATMEALRAWVARDPRQAHNQYRLAEQLAAAGRDVEALPHYLASRDEDIVPLRATGPLIEAFHEVAQAEQVPVLELNRLCSDWTRQRAGTFIPGPELFTDHVHFTMEGYRLIARALLDRMNELGWLTSPVTLSDEQLVTLAARVEGEQDACAQGEAYRNLAKTLSWAGKSAEAARLARMASELLGNDAECHFIQGLDAAERKQWHEAEAHYRAALALEPDFLKARQNLGVALGRQGRDEEAAEAYRAALAISPDHANAHYNLALVLERLGRLDDARRHMKQAVRLDPRDVDAREILAEWSK